MYRCRGAGRRQGRADQGVPNEVRWRRGRWLRHSSCPVRRVCLPPVIRPRRVSASLRRPSPRVGGEERGLVTPPPHTHTHTLPRLRCLLLHCFVTIIVAVSRCRRRCWLPRSPPTCSASPPPPASSPPPLTLPGVRPRPARRCTRCHDGCRQQSRRWRKCRDGCHAGIWY